MCVCLSSLWLFVGIAMFLLRLICSLIIFCFSLVNLFIFFKSMLLIILFFIICNLFKKSFLKDYQYKKTYNFRAMNHVHVYVCVQHKFDYSILRSFSWRDVLTVSQCGILSALL